MSSETIQSVSFDMLGTSIEFRIIEKGTKNRRRPKLKITIPIFQCEDKTLRISTEFTEEVPVQEEVQEETYIPDIDEILDSP